MNSTSERKYSLDELKQMNSRDLTEAGEGERHILLTDRNWTAVLNLLARLSAQQLETQAALALLLTRPDAEELLRRIDRNTQTRLRDLNAEMEAFAQQAGNLSGRFSSAADRLAVSTEKELTSLTRSTRDSLDAMRRGECCGLQWQDIDYAARSIHIRRNVVKLTGEEIIVKEPKTSAGDRLVFFSAEMESLLREYRHFCEIEAEHEDERELTDEYYLFRRHGERLPMTPTTFTWRFKLILKKNGLPEKLTVHSLRHTAASLMIANGTDVTTVAGILGHAQPSTTLDIYSHSFDKNKRAASAALQKSLDI